MHVISWAKVAAQRLVALQMVTSSPIGLCTPARELRTPLMVHCHGALWLPLVPHV